MDSPSLSDKFPLTLHHNRCIMELEDREQMFFMGRRYTMVTLNNKWEELRSALEYYKYISVSDEEFIYQTNGIIQPLRVGEKYGAWQRIKLLRDIFHSRAIYIENGDVRRIPIADDNGDMEIYEVITEDNKKLTLSLWGVKESPEELIQFNGKITPSDLVNPKAWNKDMCFYNEETDTAAIGIDMFRYNIKSCYKRRKSSISTKGLDDFIALFTYQTYGKKRQFVPIFDNNKIDNFVPAFIIENSETGSNIYLDVINAGTGERMTYKDIQPRLNATEIKEIHNFVADMKAAYRLLLEPNRTY